MGSNPSLREVLIEPIVRNDAVLGRFPVMLEPHFTNVWPVCYAWKEIVVEHRHVVVTSHSSHKTEQNRRTRPEAQIPIPICDTDGVDFLLED